MEIDSSKKHFAPLLALAHAAVVDAQILAGPALDLYLRAFFCLTFSSQFNHHLTHVTATSSAIDKVGVINGLKTSSSYVNLCF
jgi:hypothetical protein